LEKESQHFVTRLTSIVMLDLTVFTGTIVTEVD